MLSYLNRSPLVVCLLAAGLLVAAGCGGAPSDHPTGSRSPTTPAGGATTPDAVASPAAVEPTEVVVAGSMPSVWDAESLRTMVETYDTILVGRVSGIVDVRQVFEDLGEDLPPGQGTPRTVFSVEVAEVISSPRVKPADTIKLMQVGGLGQDGRLYVLEGNSLVDVGQTYLLFLQDTLPFTARDEFANAVFGRFIVTKEGVLQPNGWDGEPGVGAVSGISREEVQAAQYAPNPKEALAALARVTVDEAAAKILAAIAEAPLPPPPTPFPTPTPTPASAAQ